MKQRKRLVFDDMSTQDGTGETISYTACKEYVDRMMQYDVLNDLSEEELIYIRDRYPAAYIAISAGAIPIKEVRLVYANRFLIDESVLTEEEVFGEE